MMQAIIDHAQAEGFRRIMLRTSEDGRPLYDKVGFRSLETLARDF